MPITPKHVFRQVISAYRFVDWIDNICRYRNFLYRHVNFPKCHKAFFFIVFGAKMFILSLLRSLALRLPAVSQSAPPSPSLLFPFSSISFFFFSSFSFLNLKLEWGKPFLFSIEVSGHLFGLLRPSILSFSFGCSSAKSLYLCRFLWFFQWQQSAGTPVSFSGFSRIFFFLSLPKITAEKEPKRYLPCSQRTIE